MIPLMKNAFLNEFETKQALADFIIKAEKLSMGTKCSDFEKAFALKQGRSEAILFNSGGSANLAMLQALKNLGYIRDGDKIGFSALTWSTNVMPIIQLGMIPIPLDCDPNYLNILSSNLHNTIEKEKLNALFITNALGFSGDLEEIRNICEQEKILMIEDNCEALGTELLTGKTGNFGFGASFSFFVAHHMSTIEGGMVCTDNSEFGEMLRIVRANGWDRNLNSSQQIKWRRRFDISSEFDAKYTFYDLGFNFRPTEITGFLGLYQLQFLEKNIEIRKNNYLILEHIVKKNDDLIILKHEHIKKLSPFAYPVICKTPELKAKYMYQFSGAGIEIRPMIAGNIQLQPFFKKYFPNKNFDLPGADFLHKNGFYCGNYPELTETDLETIISCLFSY